MPAPTNANGLTLGRPVIDIASLETLDDMRQAIANLQRALVGMGWPAAAKSGDTTYQATYAINSGGTWTLYAGKPSDPLNPDAISLGGAGTGTTRTLICLDPAGGHTITTSGTTLTLTLKTIEYSFDLLNLTTEPAADVVITYTTGTECA